MKKLLMITILLGLAIVISAQTPFDNFLGQKWGITSTTFQKNIKMNMRQRRFGFELKDYNYLNIPTESIYFKFNPNFDSVEMDINPQQYETALKLLTNQYGKPTEVKEYEAQDIKKYIDNLYPILKQKESIWRVGNREIQLCKYYFYRNAAGIYIVENVGKGFIYFSNKENE